MHSPITIQIHRRAGCEDIPLPTYMSASAAGMDVRAACDSPVTLAPGDIRLVPCGFSMAVPDGYEVQMRPRSGLALKHGIIVPNAPGTIDPDYRGEVSVILANISREDFVVKRGMRIAQMIVSRIHRAVLAESAELPATARGVGGFGHTGL